MKLITDIKSLDTLDDRREIWHLLHRISPRDRFRVLGILCKSAKLPGSNQSPLPSWFRMQGRVLAAQRGDEKQDLALTNEIYTDIWMMVAQYGLSAKFAAETLEAFVRRGQWE